MQRTKCDNFACNRIELAESDKPYVPPYGWLTVKGGFVGSGPGPFVVVVCSLNCLEAAVAEVVGAQRNV